MECKPRYFFLLYALFFLGFSISSSLSQPNHEVFSKLSVEHGLSSVTVTSILRDSRGYLWAGTEDGLNRYNGYDFKVYRNNPSDSNSILRNRILSLFEDSRKMLWVSYGGGGVQMYDKALDAFIKLADLDTVVVKKVKEDQQGRLWFAGSGLRVLDVEKGVWTDYSRDFPEKEQLVSIDQVDESNFWVTGEQGLYYWNLHTGLQKSFRHQAGDENSLACNSIYSSLMDSNGNLWIATRGGGLDKFDPVSGNFTHFRKSANRDDGPLVNVIRSLCLDGDFIWLGTENGGLSKLDTRTNKFTHYTSNKGFPKSLNDNSIWAIHKDRWGSLWIGTFSFGLCVIDPYQDKFASLKVPLKNSVVNSILEDSKGRMWIGTEGGVTLVDNSEVHYYLSGANEKSQNGIPVLTVYEDLDKRIWIGTWSDGVFFFDEKARDFVHFAGSGATPAHLSNEHVYAIHQDSKTKSHLIASFLGLNVLTDQANKRFVKLIDSTQNIIAPHNNLKAILEDSRSDIWIGTCNGLKLYDRQQQQLISLFQDSETNNDKLLSIVFCLVEDSKGNVWAGTESGLYHITSKQSYKRYTVADGLSNHSIMGILEDNEGRLWLSTSNGLTVFDPVNGSFRNYDASDGLFVNGFKANSSFKDKNGSFYFGGSNGIIVFEPSKIVDNPNPPPVTLEALKIFNETIAINGSDSILSRHISESSSVELAHDQNMLSIDFVGLNFSASNKNKYAYRLVGFDKGWNYVGTQRTATYTNLDPGDYLFEVKASNNDGVWSGQTASLAISILPPWWQTYWAYLLYFAAVLALLYLFRRIILIREKYINDIKIERIRSENIERLNQAKLQFFTNISHEFRTPLTLILGPVQNLIDSNLKDELVRKKLLAVKQNVNRLHRLVNQLLDFRKAESGNMKIVAMESDLIQFVGEIKSSFDLLAEEMRIAFRFEHPAGPLKIWFDQDQLEKVIFNLVSNAFKHTAEGGEITIRIVNERKQVALSVEDNGRGIKPEHLKHIFQSFFSYEKGKGASGTGIGLALTKSLVELHHGTIDVSSHEGTFTRFTVRLRHGCSHFKSHEIAPDFVADRQQNAFQDVVSRFKSPAVAPEPNADEESKPLVLVIDDNLEICDFLDSLLRTDYRVKIANNGVQGFALAQDLMPDLVICDVMMPVLDGISLCKQLKEDIATSHIPLIFLTAQSATDYQLEGLENGASDYITKPFDAAVLLLKIRNHLDARRQLSALFHENKYLNIEPKQVTLNTKDELFIKTALKSIEENMENTDYSVADLCLEVGMSKATLFRKLKALTGQSANEFIRTIRLKRAAQLFAQDGFSVSEVAYKVGFNDPKYFRICFRKLFGVSPSEYADRERSDQAEENVIRS